MKTGTIAARRQAPAVTRDEVRRQCGDLLDWKLAAIVELRPSLDELEEAIAWTRGDDDVVPRDRRQLRGKIAEIVDILDAGDEPDEK